MMPDLIAYLLVYAATVVTAWWVTGLVRRFAEARAILDYPSERSSHSAPTPRGGGLAIAATALCATLVLAYLQFLAADIATALAGGTLLVAGIGWLDDRYNIPAGVRAVVYVLAAAWAVLWISGAPATEVGWTLVAVAVLAMTWLINLYNFMDGTDALAASQAVCTASMAAALLFLEGQSGLAILCLVISAAGAGFLSWNWPPARIFMGDVGSCTLGFLFGTLAAVSWFHGITDLAPWLILLSLFICDASLTLLKRMLGGETWYQAHRSHAYQLTIRLGFSHRDLSLALISANILFLFPMAYLAWRLPEAGWWLTGLAYGLAAGLWGFIQIQYRHRRSELETAS